MPFPVAGPVGEVATLHACAASVSARGEPYAYQGSFEVMAPVRTPGVENPPASTSWGSGPDVGRLRARLLGLTFVSGGMGGPASRPRRGGCLSRVTRAGLGRLADQLADTRDDGPELVPLHRERFGFLAEAEILGAQLVDAASLRAGLCLELFDLLRHPGEAALELAEALDPFLPEGEQLPAFFDPRGDADLDGTLRSHRLRVGVPSPGPGREGHPDQDHDEENDGRHEQHGGGVRGDCGDPALQARHYAGPLG